ncbi:DUF6879 family protein [Actinomadura alba]|uniref:DUF6879 domain-containing protein n=1 Tax=Actinomadura alba TaxID=406431 RepID=A0ABR7LKA5_9ACTN|nr:DUF6879 family protein [Actinomadura alba]MBC6465290.1 hypothetical protein [Actinomadura alba]
MLERIREVPGDVLDRAAYHEDFAKHSVGLSGVLWKLERAQTFREPGDSSWEAFIAGDWQRALAILDGEREAIRADAERNAQSGLEIRRLRIVESPISPYLQWEVHSLRMLAEEGFDLRTLDVSQVSDLECDEQLPEVVVIGDRVLYEVRYDAQWKPIGARRIDDVGVIGQTCEEISWLYGTGEPLLQYFDREIAPLPPPAL